MNAHFPDSSPVDEETTINANYNGSNGGRYNNIITEEKVKWAINSFDMYKSPGPDGIFPATLHHVIDELMPWLIHIFRCSLEMGYIPVKWREVRVVFIQKAGKTSNSTAKD